MEANILPYKDNNNDEDDDENNKRASNVATDDEFETYDQILFPIANTIIENLIEENKHTTDDSDSEPVNKKLKIEPKVTATRLVSYAADDFDDTRDSDADPLDYKNDLNSDSDSNELKNEIQISKEELNRSLSRSLNHSMSEEDIVIPSEPAGNCSRRLQDKVANLYEKVLRTGQDMNVMIQQRKDFRNPSIYEKLIEFCGIDEKGSNYPPELYNCGIYGLESHYEELAKVQKQDMERREKEKKEKKEKSLTIERIQGSKKVQSKWDTVTTTTTSSVAVSSSITSSSSAKNSSNNLLQISAVGPLTKLKTIS